MSRIRCPNCGFSYKKTSYGDWIKYLNEYAKFWKDKPNEIKLAIEDYFVLRGRDPKKFSLQFTTEHNGADWIKVKKVFQELRSSGFVHEAYF